MPPPAAAGYGFLHQEGSRMNTRNSVLFSMIAAAAVTTFAGTAFAEVGKKVSVATGGASPIASYPTMSDAATVAVPSSYKSKANFLKVTASYSAGCTGGDFMGSKVSVDGIDMFDAGLPYEALDEDAISQIVTKQYYLVPENQGGPAITPGATVILKMTSQFGTGCAASNVTMIVEALK
jgi:hypothetical protein